MQEQGGGRLAGWLAAAGAPAQAAERITRVLGEQAEELIAQDPWCLLEVPGITPQAADALARASTANAAAPDPADPRRTRALIGWLLRRAAAQGSTVQGADTIAAALTAAGVADPTGAVADAIENGAVLAFAEPVRLPDDADEAQMEEFEALDGEDDDNPVAMLTSARTLLAVERWAFAEQSAAEAAQRVAATPQPVEAKDPAGDGAAGQTAQSAQFRQLLDAVVANGLTLVTGAGAAQLAQVAAAFPEALLTSPSPAGLRTLAAAGADPVDARGLADQPERIGAADVVIVADAQQLDVELAAALLEGVRDGAHVVLAGDPAGPASRGPGQVLRDLLELDEPDFGGKLPHIAVKTRPTGPLTSLLDAVRHGGLPPQELLRGPDGTSKEVVIVPVRDSGEAVRRTVQLATESIPRAFGLGGRDVQVVAPAGGGPAGTAALNAALKPALNPGPGACAGFDAGDRVVITGRLAEHGLFGGETGTVGEATRDGLNVILDEPHREGVPIILDAQEAPHALRHAWALTTHEAQGGQWPAVIAVFDAESAPHLSRALAVGAIAAATQHLSVVHGAGRALSDAVEKTPDRPRRTRLKYAIRD